MKQRKTMHFLHLIMTFLTGGIWLLPWVWCATSNSRYNAQIAFNTQQDILEELKKQNRGVY